MGTAAHDGRPPAGWLTELFARLREPLWFYVRRRIGGDGDTASDIVQDAFLKLCQEPWPDIEPYAVAWLYRTCRNRAIDACRREGYMSVAHKLRDATDVTTLADQLLVPAGDALERQERLAAVEMELAQLSEPLSRSDSRELLTVNLRYKHPAGDKSSLVSFPLEDRDLAYSDADRDFRWAAAMAEFGMLLRGSQYRGTASWDSLGRRARMAVGSEPDSARSDCLEMIRIASQHSGDRDGR